MVRFRTLGCYPLTGAIESDGRRRCRRSSRRCCCAHQLRAPGPRDRPRPGGVDGEEEAGGVLLMAHVSRPDRRRTSTPTSHAARAQEPAALHHLRQRRRRQVHADRPAALRLQADLRGPAGRARSRLARSVGTQGDDIDFALLVDGLAAEREQGITIDVAYRFFATDRAQVHRRRHARATSSTRATWRPAPRPPTSP